MIFNFILIVIFYFVFKFMKICHESFIDVNYNSIVKDYIKPIDNYNLNKSFIIKKKMRDKLNNCEKNRNLRDVNELMFYDKDDYSDIYDFTEIKNREYKNKLCFW